jgi:hypothetical protein
MVLTIRTRFHELMRRQMVAWQSGLKPALRSRDTLECWLAFVVAISDSKPVMTFNPGGAWFHLY